MLVVSTQPVLRLGFYGHVGLGQDKQFPVPSETLNSSVLPCAGILKARHRACGPILEREKTK